MLSFYLDFCQWWWLAWLLPFILGLFLGRLLWGKFARRSRMLEDETAGLKSKIYKLEKELKHYKR